MLTGCDLHGIVRASITLNPGRKLSTVPELLVQQVAFVEEQNELGLCKELVRAHKLP